MKKFRLSVIVLFILSLANIATAQGNQAIIKGYIFSPDDEPAAYSTVVLMNEDSVFMKGTLSQENGLYEIDKVAPGSYFIMVRNVEFNTYVSDPLIVESNEVVLLDQIKLQTKVTGLDEVVIKGEKAMVEVHSDKMVFNVSASVNASGNNGLELLSKSPGVIVDMDKNISLQGKSGVKIYINGRPSRLSGSDLANMLEGMRSDNIESIEIITNPSAKYDAEGSGGIINILMKKNVEAGFNGNVLGSYSQGIHSRYSGGTSLNYSGRKINVFASANGSNDLFSDDFEQTTLRDEFLLDMASFSVYNRKGLNLSGGIDYLINTEHTVSLDARALVNDRSNVLESNTYISDVDNIISTERLFSEVIENGPSENYNANMHYSFIPNRSTSFTADISYGLYSSGNSTNQPNIYFDSLSNTALRNVESEYDAMTDISLVSALVDYEKSINKFTFSTGAKYSYISTDNDLDYYNIDNGSSSLDLNRSNNFSYLEKISAAYVIFKLMPTERIAMNAGLRVENTSSRGELLSATPSPDDVVDRNYFSFFPNVSISYNDQKNHGLSLSYGRRITRPNYQDLNPFEEKLSEISSWKGNPFLRPNYIDNYQLTYSFKRKLVISNTFSITEDFFSNIFITTDEKSSIITPRNMQRVTNNGLSVSYPLKVANWWSFSSFLIYNFETYDGDIEGTVIDLQAHIFNFRVQNNVKLPLDFSMEVTYFYNSPWIWRGTINVEAYHRLNIGLRREFMNNRLQVQVNATDILRSSSDYYYQSNYGGMIIDGVRKFDNRRFGISATYKFGNQNAKNNRRKNSAIDEELRRISD